MKNKTILVQKDIDKIRNNAIVVASKLEKQMIIDKITAKGVPYLVIANGYVTSMIVDATKDKLRYFLSTKNPSGKTDPEVSKVIAKDIIGEGYKILEKDNFIDFVKEEQRIDQEKITQEDIKKARDSIVVLSEENIKELLSSGGIKPVVLSNWYKVSLSVDITKENMRLVHLSVSNSIGKTDNKTAENMAREIIGEGFETLGPMFHSSVIHFIKTPRTMVDLFSNIGDKKENLNSTKVENKENKEKNKIEQNKGENIKRSEGENIKRSEGENIKRSEGENIKANEGEVKDGNEGRIKKKV